MTAALPEFAAARRCAAADQLQYPLAVVAADDETIYIADRNLPGVWKVTDGEAEVYFRGQKKFRTPLNAVRCLALDKDGRLLAGDSATLDVYRFDEQHQPQALTGGKLLIPASIAVDAEGILFVGDLDWKRIFRVPAAGGEPQAFAEIVGPRGLAFDKEGRLWAVSQGGENQVLRFTPDGKAEVVVAGEPFEFPHHIALTDDGTAYVTDNYAGAVWKIPAGGTPEKFASGPPLLKPVGLARQGARLLVADPHARALFTVDEQGTVATLVSATKR